MGVINNFLNIRWKIIALTFLFTLTIFLLSQIILRNIYLFFNADSEFYSIFKQISTSDTVINIPLILSLLLIFLVTYSLYILWNKNKKYHPLVIFLGILSFLLILILTILLTKVNGIMFIDVLSSLIPLINKGVI